MTKPKGGRGRKAPYETQQMRVPLPIKDQVNHLIEEFRSNVLDENKTFTPSHTLISTEALASLWKEIENLKTALQEAKQQILNLKTGLVEPEVKPVNLSTSFTELLTDTKNLNTGKESEAYTNNQIIGEGEAQKIFNIHRNTLRKPREQGKKEITLYQQSQEITLEYVGQPQGKGTPHLWKIIAIRETPTTMSLLE